MAFRTSCRELLSDVIGIGGGIVIIGMATGTGIGRIVVIAVVAGCAVIGNGCMRPDQLIEVIVNGESGWRPSGICCVTCFTGGGQIQCYVTWISAGCVVIGMATCAGCGCVVVVTLVTVVTCHSRVRACERPHGAVIERGRHPCVLIVAVSASCRELLSDVVGVGGGVIIVGMATCTGCGRICIVTLVTIVARHGCMRPHNRIEGVIQR